MRGGNLSNQVEIINTCTKPPLGLVWQVRRSLRWIDAQDLNGLSYVQIADQLPEIGPEDDAADWAKRASADGTDEFTYGWYARPSEDRPGHIILYGRRIYRGLPGYLWWSTLPTLRIARSLAHEVAHHLVATRGYVFQPGEDKDQEESLANAYAAKVLVKMTSHWPYQLGQRGMRELASWHYVYGIADYNAKKYRSAADSFYKSWDLDPQNKESLNLYWRAREMSGG